MVTDAHSLSLAPDYLLPMMTHGVSIKLWWYALDTVKCSSADDCCVCIDETRKQWRRLITSCRCPFTPRLLARNTKQPGSFRLLERFTAFFLTPTDADCTTEKVAVLDSSSVFIFQCSTNYWLALLPTLGQDVLTLRTNSDFHSCPALDL